MYYYEKMKWLEMMFQIQCMLFLILGITIHPILFAGVVCGMIWKASWQYEHDFQNAKEVIKDLPRHRVFTYANQYSLSENFFQQAYRSIENGYVYIVLSDTGSPASEIFSIFTKRKYNHVSIAFDENLNTMVSYNNGEKRNEPGMNQERLEQFRKKQDACVMVYRLKVTAEQKKNMISKIEQINQEGSSYNTIGVLLKCSFQPNIMFCSQFVYFMLRYAGAAYFEKQNELVTPMDFVELDYKRQLEFIYERRL